MDHLPAGMHPGVCAPCAVDHRRRARDPPDRRLKGALDRWSLGLGLALKAMIVRPIIFNAARQLAHPRRTSRVPLQGYTRAICAISALSPRRLPSLVMRV